MNLVFFAHPDFLGHKSMDRFTKLLSEGMARRGHHVEVWTPDTVISGMSKIPFVQKWLGYFDQYVAFPRKVRRLLKSKDKDTLFVFTDQSQGPWVPLIGGRPSIIHCHDFLALRSALGEIEENRTSFMGRMYQRLIRKGFSQGRNFISVSHKTKEDLDKYLLSTPRLSEVVYNGLHQQFIKQPHQQARDVFGKKYGLDLSKGYLLHVGGNMWYKNRLGVIDIYEAWRDITTVPVPLVLIGAPLSEEMNAKVVGSKYRSDIYPLSEVGDEHIGLAYAGASVFLFPSLGEGFGWPIAEAMASGTLVITTGEAPMSEVAGQAGFFIPRKPREDNETVAWTRMAAGTVDKLMTLTTQEREQAVAKGVDNAARFETNSSLNQIEAIYKKVLLESKQANVPLARQ